MKLKSKVIAIGSIIALVASPLAMADEAAAGNAGADAEPTVEVSPDEEVVIIDEEVVLVDEEIIECETGDTCEHTEPVLDKDLVDVKVPGDWVKRGGEEVLENPDVIFYTMATADGGVVAPVAAKGDIDLGQDDKVAAIEAKSAAAAPQINREKKGPMALVNKGRVFLR